MSSDPKALLMSHGRTGRASDYLAMARRLEDAGDLRNAATAHDRAFGLDPDDAAIVEARRSLLDRLSVVEHGIIFRYIPAGTFLMGSDSGDPDEAPVHPVRLDEYWMAEAPLSWAAYCDLMDWSPAPEGMPKETEDASSGGRRSDLFMLREENKLRLQYCEDETTRAKDWHCHTPEQDPATGEWKTRAKSSDYFRPPDRGHPDRPWAYDRKPMVAVSWREAEDLCTRLSTGPVVYRLPTEAEWEKASRGGRIDARYPWGNEPPDASRCDFDRFDAFAIRPMRQFPTNDYGLYAMSGCVWEWTSDWYDSEYYGESPPEDPRGPSEGERKVLRGGSWSDCAEAVTVTFRMACEGGSWRDGKWGAHLAPNIGFRLCRAAADGR